MHALGWTDVSERPIPSPLDQLHNGFTTEVALLVAVRTEPGGLIGTCELLIGERFPIEPEGRLVLLRVPLHVGSTHVDVISANTSDASAALHAHGRSCFARKKEGKAAGRAGEVRGSVGRTAKEASEEEERLIQGKQQVGKAAQEFRIRRPSQRSREEVPRAVARRKGQETAGGTRRATGEPRHLDQRAGYHGVKMVLTTRRPWLYLYGNRIGGITVVQHELALIQKVLHEELLIRIFSHLPPVALGKVACVCKGWRDICTTPKLWNAACQITWQMHGEDLNRELVHSKYGGDWYRMWIERPRLRMDGLYISRNTYIRTGIVHWDVKNPVHLVRYFRYYRFYPDGTFVYKTSPHPPEEVIQVMHTPKTEARGARVGVYSGSYHMEGNKIHVSIIYPGKNPTEIRTRLLLRSTCPGAYNRLNIESLTSSYEERSTMYDPHEGVRIQDEARVQTHRTGLNPYIFVPFEEIRTTPLNLPIDQMDYFVPG